MKIIQKSISELSEVEKREIDQFIDLNRGLVFHYTKLNEIVSLVNNTELFYSFAYNNDLIIGICPIHKVKKGLLRLNYSCNGNYEIPYGGWVFNKNQIDFERLWKCTSLAPFESLTYWTSFFYDIPEPLKQQSSKFETGLIDLSFTIEELWQNSVHSKRRNMIRKAEKSGILIKNYGKEGFQIYQSLMVEMRNKTGLKETTSAFYNKILDSYCSDKALISIAFLNEKPVSGTIILGNMNVMHYWQGASVSDAPNLGQGELLQWEAIKWAKNQGAKYYDLCVIEPERLPFIAQFKMGFSKDTVPFYCIYKKTLTFRVTNKIQDVFSN
jgi:hypothetical protein